MKTFVLLVFAGLTSAASARTDVVASNLVVRLTWSVNDIGVGSTAVATISASWDGPATTYLSSVNIDLIASRDGVVAMDSAPVGWNVPILGYDGVGQASGADIIGLDAAQFSLFAPPQTGNPCLITTFSVTSTLPVSLSYSARNSLLGTIAAFTISDTALPTANPAQFGAEVFVAEVLNTPSPAGVAMLGVGGLVVMRRRR